MNKILGLLFLMAISTLGYADTKHPIDVGLEQCLAKDTNYSTLAMTTCISTAEQSWDKELNNNYEALMKKLNKNGQNKLKAAQIAWIKYRDLEFKNIGAIYGSMQGTIYIPARTERVLAITKTRALELNSYLTDLH